MFRYRAVLSLVMFASGAAIAAAGDQQGFRCLFDGRSLDGWKAADMSFWSVADGAITAKITQEHPQGDCIINHCPNRICCR
jgi:hypothetical protein